MANNTITCDLDVTSECLMELRALSEELNSLQLVPLHMTSIGATATELQHTWQLMCDYKLALLNLINQSYSFADNVYRGFLEADVKSAVTRAAQIATSIVAKNTTVSPNSSPTPSSGSHAATSVDSGRDLIVPQKQYVHSTPKYVSDESNRSAENYKKVIAQFDVTHSERYKKNVFDGSEYDKKTGKKYEHLTWCNIFAWDATEAMGAEIPHWYNPSTGEPMAVGANGALEMGTERMNTWMSQFGSKYGWREMTAQEAQMAANSGKPTIALSKGHVAMVVPAEEGFNPNTNGPRITQAGGKNFENGLTSDGFGSQFSQVKYYTHD